ncbi:hypothetical protein MSM1_20905 [Mycobacterium sp. SM1]|uniref:DUF6542 domain-containing protein n=1 Tax=Mycobacterium sp. SM1 TaxID=2816243 RepID=UPI001BCEBDA3|nr:DUF6542 domain-containing protein [Mycobacterium sp. SM1]MBS4730666.1 hypothetical protein [Mycobacterium sp. SM1]
MSVQRARSAVAAEHRSIHPSVPGVPWWAAVVIAATATALGYAFDAGSGAKQLTNVFAALYASGCVAAVIAVRQSGIFTAVIQPPLILFVSVPGAYWLFHGAKITGLRDILINCGYPLIERFPLMASTSAGVLLIGIVRWSLGRAARPRTKSAGAAGPVARPAASRSRRVAPARDDTPEAPVGRARRRSRAPDGEAAEPPAPRRRSRVPHEPDLRGRPPREIGRDPRVRTGRATAEIGRDPRVRAGRPLREIGRDPRVPTGRATARDSRYDPYEPLEPGEPLPPFGRRRRPAPPTADGTTATHHPISRVRYRGSAGDEEGPVGPKTWSTRDSTAESWEYDI